MDYARVFEELSGLERQMSSCVGQYEERLKRVNDYLEQSNASYIKAQDEMKQLRVHHEEELRVRDLSLQRLLSKSTDIMNKAVQIDDKKHSQKSGKKVQREVIGELLKDLDSEVTKLMVEQNSGSSDSMSDLRDHLIELHTRVSHGLLKRLIACDEQMQRQEQEWRQTCDKLIEDHQTIKDQSNSPCLPLSVEEQLEEELAARTARFEGQLRELKSEHYSLVRTNKEQSEKLTKELENSMKTHYVKNVLYSYLTTSDPTVHANLVKVLTKAMHFSEEEAERIAQFQEESRSSTFSKVRPPRVMMVGVVDGRVLLRTLIL